VELNSLGGKQQKAFDEIKSFLTSPPVLQAPKSGVPFRLYVAEEPSMIGVVLTQETDGNEYVVAYESRRLLDAETRYTFIEKLCPSLYYACTKLRHYLLSRICYVACHTDIIKCMLQKPILSGRVGKWAYGLVEYDLRCEPIGSMKGQIVADFIVQHRIDKQYDLDVGYVTFTPRKLYFLDRLVEVVVVLELLLCHLVELFLKPLAGWIINVLIIKLIMKLSCLDYKYYMTWE
jgi:hypothetical protein